jgi:opacity protein-like surface antigen
MAILGASSAMAQTTTDYKKSEFFVGYSNNQVDTGADSGNNVRSFFNDRISFHGFEISGVYNVSRYVGIKGDFSGTYRNKNFSQTVNVGATQVAVSFETKNSLYNVLGGVQVKDNTAKTRVKPFAHALVGVGHGRTKITDVNCPTGTFCANLASTDSETALAGAFGGGLDIKVSDKIDIRAIQIDYNPIKFDAGTSHNVRIGVGIVF